VFLPLSGPLNGTRMPISRDDDPRRSLGAQFLAQGLSPGNLLVVRNTAPQYQVPSDIRAEGSDDDGWYLVWDTPLVGHVEFITQMLKGLCVPPSLPHPADPARCLVEFSALYSKPVPEIVAFASRYGVLRICEHSTEWRDGHLPIGDDGLCATCREEVRGHAWPEWRGTWREPVNAWRLASRQLRTLIDLFFALREADMRGDKRLRDAASYWEAIPSQGDQIVDDVHEAWGFLRVALDLWILHALRSAGGISLGCHWIKDRDWGTQRMQLVHTPQSLSGVLVVGLVSLLELPHRHYFCSNCDRLYEVPEDKRLPSLKRPNYCPTCSANDYAVVRTAKKRAARQRKASNQ